MKSYSLPVQLEEEIDRLEELIHKFKKGEVTAVELKAHRVPFGVYEQREPDTYMMRVRCAAGSVSPLQLEQIAGIASRHTTSDIHITSRQELQIHYIKLDDIIPLVRALKKIGLATRGGGGNTIRNVTACPLSGVCPDEVFDVRSHAVGISEHLLAQATSYNLPRKFKIAFSGCCRDCAGCLLNDLGFIAREKSGRKGFQAFVGGGMGASSAIGGLLEEFIPESELGYCVNAVKNVYYRMGDRKDRHHNRLRFLLETVNIDGF